MTARVAGHQLIPPDVKLGRDVQIYGFVNLYGVRGWRRDVTTGVPAGATVAGTLHECSARRA